jgi:hypothetical protein
MRFSQQFRSKSKYLRAADIDGDTPVVIARVAEEEVGRDRERKPILYFRGMQKGLVVNMTNANRLIAAFGDEMDDWTGATITLFTAIVPFGGEEVPAIRVRVDSNPAPKHPTPPKTKTARAAQAPLGKDGKDQLELLDDEIPF